MPPRVAMTPPCQSRPVPGYAVSALVSEDSRTVRRDPLGHRPNHVGEEGVEVGGDAAAVAARHDRRPRVAARQEDSTTESRPSWPEGPRRLDVRFDLRAARASTRRPHAGRHASTTNGVPSATIPSHSSAWCLSAVLWPIPEIGVARAGRVAARTGRGLLPRRRRAPARRLHWIPDDCCRRPGAGTFLAWVPRRSRNRPSNSGCAKARSTP